MKDYTACIILDGSIEIIYLKAHDINEATSKLYGIRPRLDNDPRWNIFEGKAYVGVWSK